jgi:glucosamine--fructose-6-phosphate aminotransferase (isomerizing)
MCGIFAYAGFREAEPILIDGLSRLEYRGYDSAGLATVTGRHLHLRKRAGRIANLTSYLSERPAAGCIGISHTRWATHGPATHANAHPHVGGDGLVAVVHNGVIENYVALKEQLQSEGVVFHSDTDTEVIAQLIASYLNGDLVEAVQAALHRLKGTYGLAVVSPQHPDVIVGARLCREEGSAHFGGLNLDSQRLRQAERLVLTACGTSYHAALVGEYLFEELARIPVEVEYASEFRYRNSPLERNTIVVAITQSGETADTLAALRESQRKGHPTLALCNVVGSTIAREADGGVYLHAGPEVGVASTKAFTSQVTVLAMLALYLGRMRHLSTLQGTRMVEELLSLPDIIRQTLSCHDDVRRIAERYFDVQNFLYLGRQSLFPVALEGALKLKEVSYIHAEGYPAAEMKHGPIALVDEDTPSVFLVPRSQVFDKVMSNLEEVKARGGPVIAIASEGDNRVAGRADEVIYVPDVPDYLQPLVTVVPLQLLAYHIALLRGCDVDKPRNLAKSVTVE